MTDRYHVITGGPGAGKTALIDALQRAGFACSIEAGRGIIQDQTAIDGPALPWRDPAAFAEQMLGWEMRSHHLAARENGPVFFDRGVLDVIGYLRLTGLPVPAHTLRAGKHFRYNRRVFIAPPWPEIFHQDAERRQDLAEAARTFAAMVSVYTEFGYELIELPRVSVERRVAFLIDKATGTSA